MITAGRRCCGDVTSARAVLGRFECKCDPSAQLDREPWQQLSGGRSIPLLDIFPDARDVFHRKSDGNSHYRLARLAQLTAQVIVKISKAIDVGSGTVAPTVLPKLSRQVL